MEKNTQHATAERADWDKLYEQMRLIKGNAAIQGQMEPSPEPYLLLNTNRQVVFANQTCREWLGVDDPATIYGCRPGEILNCKHAPIGQGGCGTSKACRLCGAVNAVLKSVHGHPDVQRCSIPLSGAKEPLDLIVFSMPVTVARRSFILITLNEENPEAPKEFKSHIFALQNFVKSIECA